MSTFIFVDPGYKPQTTIVQRPPVSPTSNPNPQPPPPNPISLRNLVRLVPDDGFNWSIIDALWDRREQPLDAWRIANKLAADFNPESRERERRLRMSVWEDITKLTRSGWVIRHGGKIQLNLERLSGRSG